MTKPPKPFPKKGKKGRNSEASGTMTCPRCSQEVRKLPNGKPAFHNRPGSHAQDFCK